MTEQPPNTDARVLASATLQIDPTKITNNPFADTAYLRRELERFAVLFEGIPKDADELHSVWNRYQHRRGTTAAVQLSLGIDTLLMLDAVHKVMTDRGDDGITGLVILFHIALLEQVEQGQYVAFSDWLLGRLKDPKPPLPTATTVAALKDYLVAREQEYESDHGAAKVVTRALQKGLSLEDKRRLLLGFRFRFRDPDSPSECRLACQHLHCRDLKAAGKPVDPDCLGCQPPSDADLDLYIGALARRLYAMRSVLVHRAMWVWFARIPLVLEGMPVSSGTLLDGYYDRDDRLVVYEVRLLMDELVTILRRCIWKRIAG